MSIISAIKNFFVTTAGTPVTVSTDLSAASNISTESENRCMAKGKQLPNVNSSHKLWKKAFKYLTLAIKLTSRILAGAITLTILAHFVPELREQMPSFYRLVDSLLVCFEWLCSQLWSVVGRFF